MHRLSPTSAGEPQLNLYCTSTGLSLVQKEDIIVHVVCIVHRSTKLTVLDCCVHNANRIPELLASISMAHLSRGLIFTSFKSRGSSVSACPFSSSPWPTAAPPSAVKLTSQTLGTSRSMSCRSRSAGGNGASGLPVIRSSIL